MKRKPSSGNATGEGAPRGADPAPPAEAAPPEPSPPAPETVTVEAARLAALEAEAAEWKDRCLRMAADFDNFRKRAEREREDVVCYANERLISDLLPILDNLERALSLPSEAPPGEAFLEGVRMISRQLHGLLERCGLEPVAAVGREFDPNLHQAVGVLPSAKQEEGRVLAELQRGYRLRGRVLRPSMVHVAGPRGGGPPPRAEDEE